MLQTWCYKFISLTLDIGLCLKGYQFEYNYLIIAILLFVNESNKILNKSRNICEGSSNYFSQMAYLLSFGIAKIPEGFPGDSVVKTCVQYIGNEDSSLG